MTDKSVTEQPAPGYVQTPAQTVGPFYGFALPYERGPELVPGCVQDAALTFRVNGKVVDGAVTNDLQLASHRADLVLR